jgi:hypothetical protein
MRSRASVYAAQAQAAANAGAVVRSASNAAAALAEVAAVSGGSPDTIAAVATDVTALNDRLNRAGIAP